MFYKPLRESCAVAHTEISGAPLENQTSHTKGLATTKFGFRTLASQDSILSSKTLIFQWPAIIFHFKFQILRVIVKLVLCIICSYPSW